MSSKKNEESSGSKREKNEIYNKSLKETLASNALLLMKQSEDYDGLDNVVCKFGYLFTIEGHGVESLFKITTDKGICYFAAQGDSIKRVNLDEELFESYSETFLSSHQ